MRSNNHISNKSEKRYDQETAFEGGRELQRAGGCQMWYVKIMS